MNPCISALIFVIVNDEEDHIQGGIMVTKSSRIVAIFSFILMSSSLVCSDGAQKIVAWDIHEVLCSKPEKHGWQCVPNPQTFKIVEALSNNGVKQVIFSNISNNSFHKLIARYPHYFKHFDLSHSEANGQGVFSRKPHGKYINKFLQKNPIDPQNIIFFDDIPQNIEAARRHGIDAHIFYNPAQVKEILKQKGML